MSSDSVPELTSCFSFHVRHPIGHSSLSLSKRVSALGPFASRHLGVAPLRAPRLIGTGTTVLHFDLLVGIIGAGNAARRGWLGVRRWRRWFSWVDAASSEQSSCHGRSCTEHRVLHSGCHVGDGTHPTQVGRVSGEAGAQLLLAEARGLGPLRHLHHGLQILAVVLQIAKLLYQFVYALFGEQLCVFVRLGHLCVKHFNAMAVSLLVLLQ
ncbi:hypothetical protein PG989_006613 [Apiospora arundinis]